MSETLTAQIRLAVTVTLAGALIMIVLSLSNSAVGIVDRFMDKYAYAMESPPSTILNKLSSSETISAASVYRILEEKIDSITNLSIHYADGTVTSDYKTLLQHASAFMVVNTTSINGAYTVEVNEVK